MRRQLVDIHANAVLADLEALRNVTRIDGDMTVRNNPALPTRAGLRGLATLGGRLILVENRLVPAAEVAELRQRLGK